MQGHVMNCIYSLINVIPLKIGNTIGKRITINLNIFCPASIDHMTLHLNK